MRGATCFLQKPLLSVSVVLDILDALALIAERERSEPLVAAVLAIIFRVWN